VDSDSVGDELLRSAYSQALARAAEQPELRTLAFSLLSSGIFRAGRPLATVLGIGLTAIRDFTAQADRGEVTEVYFVAFTPAEQVELIRAAPALLAEQPRQAEEEPRQAAVPGAAVLPEEAGAPAELRAPVEAAPLPLQVESSPSAEIHPALDERA